MANNKLISVRGAREHNLKSIDVDIPRDKLIVMTGLSGSGKSSLAFDTIYAEGQRRYVESLSAYARQFLQMMQKPDVERIDGLSPAISIEQKTTSRNPRSTVGTITEVYDYMRLLWARIGIPYSPATGLPIESQTISQMVDRVMTLADETRIYILAPVVRARKGEYKKEIDGFMRQGFQRILIDGEIYRIDEAPAINKKVKHDISVVVDRIVIADDIKNRLADSLATALNLADGIAIVQMVEQTDEAGKAAQIVFSEKFACPVSGFTIAEIEPRLFSFNSPQGACSQCGGLGTLQNIDPDLVIANADLSIDKGAITPWSRQVTMAPYYSHTLNGLAEHYGFSLTTPWRQLAANVKDIILNGSGKQKITFIYDSGNGHVYQTSKKFEGVIPNLNRRYRETDSERMREEIAKYFAIRTCDSCDGFRLKPEALAIRITDCHIGQVTQLAIGSAYNWFSQLSARLSAKHNEIARAILKEIISRLKFLVDVGLDYLTLARGSATLSGGESQRIRLASQIGSGLTGVLYVLDEPSIGLHQRDNDRLLTTLKHLRDLGNTVIVVEHDEDAIREADHVIDFGPGAGVHGGEVVAAGSPAAIMANPDSLTGRYLNGSLTIPMPPERQAKTGYNLTITGARGNNLKNITVDFPLGKFICVTGVSGGGKSTLIIDTLYLAMMRHLHSSKTSPAPYDKITGLEHIDKVIDIDQSPIGRTPRSNPATYAGVFTPIREWFAGLPEAKTRGYLPGRFSFNVKGGRCEACQGDGVVKIEMHFLPDVYVECEVCKGKRYNRETLEVKFKDKSIADVLDMTIEQAQEFFAAIPAIRDKLETLNRVGLSYIRLGQQATTLSGGEAQRVKLARELAKKSTGRTVYLLDEPTTGLHFHDVAKLLQVIYTLVASGNTVIVIEHNLEVIKTADWLIDLGPEGGDEGGHIVATGPPEAIINSPDSYTGKYLAKLYQNKASMKTKALQNNNKNEKKHKVKGKTKPVLV